VLLLIESSRSSGRSLLRGIADFARDHGPWAFYWETGGLEKAWPQLRSLDVDGIILRDVEPLHEVLAWGIPAIVVGHSLSEVHGLVNVITDSDSIGRMGADHLIRCGFQHFGFIGIEGVPWSTPREESFTRRIRDAGFTLHSYPRPSNSTVPRWKDEQTHLVNWLRSQPKPLGLMACNDDRGEQLIEACKVADILVPDQVGILGVDNDDLVCDLSDPPMSSVALNFERAGYECARVLDRMMHGHRQPAPSILVAATHIVARRSTDVVAVSDPHLATALRFIRDHSRGIVTVPDVARAAGLSRRVLEKRFQKFIKRSALAEIRRTRVERICRMLAETNQTVSQIAQSLGFTSTEHVARYFRREKRMTPLAYRRQFGRR
jgi:LacI family transcriptional regulator